MQLVRVLQLGDLAIPIQFLVMSMFICSGSGRIVACPFYDKKHGVAFRLSHASVGFAAESDIGVGCWKVSTGRKQPIARYLDSTHDGYTEP